MSTLLAWLSFLIWWLLSCSVGALFSALAAWAVLRWAEHGTGTVFNRVYLACLLWHLAGCLIGLAAWHFGRLQPPYAAALASPWARGALLANMLLGAFLLWRLVPRSDAHRVRPASACLAAATVTAIGLGAATALLS